MKSNWQIKTNGQNELFDNSVLKDLQNRIDGLHQIANDPSHPTEVCVKAGNDAKELNNQMRQMALVNMCILSAIGQILPTTQLGYDSKTISDAIKLEQNVVKYISIASDIVSDVLKLAPGGVTVLAVSNILKGVIAKYGLSTSASTTQNMTTS